MPYSLSKGSTTSANTDKVNFEDNLKKLQEDAFRVILRRVELALQKEHKI